MSTDPNSQGADSGRPTERLPRDLYKALVDAGWDIPTTEQEVEIAEKYLERNLERQPRAQWPMKPRRPTPFWRRGLDRDQEQSREREGPGLER